MKAPELIVDILGPEPKEPFVAVQKQDGGFMAILPGAHLLLVKDPSLKSALQGGVAPFVLERLDPKTNDVHLICACGRPGCTFKLVWKAKKSGRHPLMKDM